MAKRKNMQEELRLDLHGMTAYEAKLFLTEKMNFLSPKVSVVRIIHGYHGGSVLRDLVRNEFYHYKIDEIIPIFANDGETLYYIKQDN